MTGRDAPPSVDPMKAIVILPPVAALLVVASWIGAERHSISALETESAVLRKSISARESPDDSAPAAAAPGAPGKSTKALEPIDWKATAALMTQMRQDGMGNMREMMRFQRRLLEMSGPELAAALDEIAMLDLPEDARATLESMLLGPLAQKDPEMALDRYQDRAFDERGMMSWQLAEALGQWAKKDTVAATAWLDKEIAAGKLDSRSLDGRSRPREQFEGKLIGILLGADSATAAVRLKGFSGETKKDILSNNVFDRSAEDTHAAYADLVRSALPAEEQASVLGQQARNFVSDKGFADVDKFLARISATASERIAAAKLASQSEIGRIARKREITTADLDTMRDWVGSNAPDTVGEATGSALANAMTYGEKNSFAHAAELAGRYHESSGDDQIITAFFKNGQGWENKEESRTLAGKINDPELRAKTLENLK